MTLHRERAADGRMHFRGASLAEYARGGPLAAMAERKGVRVPPVDQIADAVPVVAILNEDMWVVVCPDCERNVQFVWVDLPLFFCAYCFNAKAGGRWRRVTLPDERRRRQIEDIVGHRAFAHERNWRGESVAALRRENLERGDPVPDADGA